MTAKSFYNIGPCRRCHCIAAVVVTVVVVVIQGNLLSIAGFIIIAKTENERLNKNF
jgi:hypothetical protein